MLAKVSRCISSLVVAPPRRSANLKLVCVVGSPRPHACSCEALAFLSESSNRVIITGIYLRHGSDPMVSEAERYSDVHCVSAVLRKIIL